MSRSHRKGYEAEHAIEGVLQSRYPSLAENILRPRAGAAKDKGDLHGLPVVISVKNYADLRLATWVDEMLPMCEHAAKQVGVVWHKRYRAGSPKEWYVTTTRPMAYTLTQAYQRPFTIMRTGMIRGREVLLGHMRNLDQQMVYDTSEVGLLYHVRKGDGTLRTSDYVTMMGRCFLPLLDAMVAQDTERRYEQSRLRVVADG